MITQHLVTKQYVIPPVIYQRTGGESRRNTNGLNGNSDVVSDNDGMIGSRAKIGSDDDDGPNERGTRKVSRARRDLIDLGPFDNRTAVLVRQTEPDIVFLRTGKDSSYVDTGDDETRRRTNKKRKASSARRPSRRQTVTGGETLAEKQPIVNTKYSREIRKLQKVRSLMESAETEFTKSDSPKRAMNAHKTRVNPASDNVSAFNDIFKQQLKYTFILWAALIMVVVLVTVGYFKSRGWLIAKEYVVNYA